ncbi:MAG: trigger factor [Lachnospiraceae bacterium]|nr:trigger factor [Lachnospiraceae bacterium]MBO7600787.1 trigger factor [Lachnospiraceae bacterium]
MSVSVEKLENSMAKLTIEVPEDEVEKALDRAFNKNKNKVSIPGFRKGKAPRAVIEKMYGPEIFYEDAANDMIETAYDKAYDECGEEIVSTPEIEVVQIEKGKPFIFTAKVALKPEIKLGKYKGVKIAKIDTEVTEDEVNAAIDKERENSARSVSVDRPVQDKDETMIDFEGFVDGVAFEGGKGENYPLTIGSGAFIPGFEEQLIGAKKGDEVEVKVTFPEDYHAEELKGKEAVFKCKINEVKEKELPELDDEFASEVSEYDTFAEYKDSVKKGLEEKKAKEAKDQKEDAVIDAIIEASEMNIPEAMLETQKRQMIQDFAQRIQSQGLSMDQYMKFTGLTADKLLEQMAPQAEKRIKSRLVLENVVKAEKIEVSDEDYENELKRMSEDYKMEIDKLKEMIGENETAIKQIKEDLAIQKAVDFVVDNAKEA